MKIKFQNWIIERKILHYHKKHNLNANYEKHNWIPKHSLRKTNTVQKCTKHLSPENEHTQNVNSKSKMGVNISRYQNTRRWWTPVITISLHSVVVAATSIQRYRGGLAEWLMMAYSLSCPDDLTIQSLRPPGPTLHHAKSLTLELNMYESSSGHWVDDFFHGTPGVRNKQWGVPTRPLSFLFIKALSSNLSLHKTVIYDKLPV